MLVFMINTFADATHFFVQFMSVATGERKLMVTISDLIIKIKKTSHKIDCLKLDKVMCILSAVQLKSKLQCYKILEKIRFYIL